MYVKYLKKMIAQTDSGAPIEGRTWYIYEFNTEEEAAYCEAAYLMDVRTANFANQLFHRDNLLILDVVDWWANAEIYKDSLLKKIENRRF